MGRCLGGAVPDDLKDGRQIVGLPEPVALHGARDMIEYGSWTRDRGA